ncbi:MAG: HDOD domain-containing protein [Chitinivibrionales bacterium]|nr:HDOD domain-containing protein [Chitinivibrionales bacterium]
MNPSVTETKITGGTKTDPLILLYSPRERIRDILTVGLMQCNYQVIQADVSYLATIKAYQFLPDLVIIDVTPDHTRDILLIPRLKKSVRTKNTPILLITPQNLRTKLENILLDSKEGHAEALYKSTGIIEYPFHFKDIRKKISQMVSHSGQTTQQQEEGMRNVDESLRKAIAEKLLDKHISKEQKLGEIERTLSKQWVFPFTVIKALDIIESDGSCCNGLGKCISTDAGASAAILRVANSVHYARRQGKPISEIADAVVRLGFRETRNLLACLALIDLTPDVHKRYGFSRQEFWFHSLCTALIAEKLCADIKHPRPELAFIAGLVHDLGKIPLDINFHTIFSRLLEETANNVTSFHETEERLLGFTHAILGHFLANKWNFPDPIGMTLLNHHNSKRILAATPMYDKIIQESVFVANIIAKAMNFGHSCDEFIDEIPEEMLRDLNIPHGPDHRFFAGVIRNLDLLCRFLNLSMKNLFLAKAEHTAKKEEIIVVLNKDIAFHPLILALKNTGYTVKTTSRYMADLQQKAKVVIFMSEKGVPLDIEFNEEEVKEKEKTKPDVLKIFCIDSLPALEMTRSFKGSDIFFLNRKHLDFRLLLHTIDHHLEKIVTPETVEIESHDLK